MNRCQDEDPPEISILAIRCQTGAFITRWRATRVRRMPQRTTRIHRRTGHRHRASTPAAYPNTGVLELQATVITVAETIPSAAILRYFLPFHHSATNNGTRTAPKVPAKMGWEKQPIARSFPSRSISVAYA